mmetsp:Transcript_5380/g.6291  ORF Transcript_5380/g.6291 Transcript_5380/m.6291 type:complete len:137 (-) Transcript_5380:13-423(-)
MKLLEPWKMLVDQLRGQSTLKDILLYNPGWNKISYALSVFPPMTIALMPSPRIPLVLCLIGTTTISLEEQFINMCYVILNLIPILQPIPDSEYFEYNQGIFPDADDDDNDCVNIDTVSRRIYSTQVICLSYNVKII